MLVYEKSQGFIEQLFGKGADAKMVISDHIWD